jgi:cation transport protein ChaC
VIARGLWIFGYGSLVWRPEFLHSARRPAWIAGFRRVFWQGSTDHRGVPGAPGRVVTLTRDAQAKPRTPCWGMAYHVEAEHVSDVLAGLDHREKGGYERIEIELHFADASESSPTNGLLYIASESNPNYLGPAPADEIARQVLASSGPSGENQEYVLRLAEALLEICPALDAGSEEALAVAGRVRSLADRTGVSVGTTAKSVEIGS